MSVPQEMQQDQQKRIVASLARESDMPIAEVATLFEHERAELEVGARITTFLNVFAIRQVQEALRRRNADGRTVPFELARAHAT